jgi:hypothetical protein
MAFGLRSRPHAPEQEVKLDLTPLGARQPVSTPRPDEPVQVSRIFLEPEEELRRRIRLRQTPRPLLMLVLSYTLGGMAPAFLDMGKRRFTWAFLTLTSAAIWGATVWKWPLLRAWIETGRLPLLPCMVVLGVVTLLLVQAWSRSVWLAAQDVRFVPERLPGLLRRPVSVALVGALLPGAGYLMAKHARRAASVVWIVGPLALAGLTLWQGEWFWNVNRASGVQGLPLPVMELIFIASVAVLLLGGLIWVTSAFDAARLAAFRAGQRASARADWLGFAVIAVTVAFFVTLAPENMARNLDQLATGMRHDGYRIIPLGMQHAAMRLDPSRPRYVMRAAELHDLMNQPEAAHELREQLRTRWQEYAEFLLRQEAEVNATVPLRPIGLTESEEGSATAKP